MQRKVDFIQQRVITSSVVGPGKLQRTFQNQPCTKKSHGHYLVVCCPSGRLQLSESQ